MTRPKQFDPDVAVEQAMEVFWRKGYASTTPQDLVDALGIGKGSLYNAFGSKRALFERALRRYRERQASVLLRALEEPGPAKVRLRRALEAVVRTDLADPDRRGCMAVNTAAEVVRTDEVATDLVLRAFAHIESAFRAVVVEGQRAGEISPERDPDGLAAMLQNTVAGLRLAVRVAEGPERPARIIDAVIDSL
ncbi:TetR/AcrR family transcriptional regulator [Streptomyces sp. NPDC002574]|uniref:TetR/AcrR family transcriptional regulator n=1 Tax=Streptomyces sp. NPDC002574 TaxID=3364652 RepID=UPI0036D09EDE